MTHERGFGRAMKAGIVAWVVFTAIIYMAPLMGVPKMDLPALLGGMFGMNSTAIGWVMHFMIGIVLALIYAYWMVDHLSGAAWLRGLEYGVLPWLAMMVIVAPMLPLVSPAAAKMPPGFFLTNLGIMATMGSLIAHLIWGTVLGAMYGTAEVSRQVAARA